MKNIKNRVANILLASSLTSLSWFIIPLFDNNVDTILGLKIASIVFFFLIIIFSVLFFKNKDIDFFRMLSKGAN